MPTLTQRFRSLLSRGIPPPAQSSTWQHFGTPAPFKPQESLRAYGDNVWLYAAVNVIANEVSRTPFVLKRRLRDGDEEEIVRHQALETLRRPQGRSTKAILTYRQLLFLTTQHFLLNGEAFHALEDRSGISGSPRKITPMTPGNVYQKISEAGEITGYVYRQGTRDIPIRPEDVVHFKRPNPEDWSRGLPPTKPVRFALDAHFESDTLQFNRLKNNAIPAGVLTSELAVNEQERTRLLDIWNRLFGGGRNAGKTAFLPSKIKFEAVQQSPQDMQFIESKNLFRDEILANYAVGMEMLGKTEGQTRANAEASNFVFMRFCVLPILEMVADTLTTDYLPQFAGSEDLFVGFPDPVPENMEDKRANVETLASHGMLTPNEGRQMFGLDPLPNEAADEAYLNFNLTALGAEPPDPSNNEAPADGPSEQDQ